MTPAASISSNTETTSPAQQPPKTVPTVPSADPTTDELKQHAARLQEQLSSMLFTEAPATKLPAPEKPAAPKPDIIPTETVQKILQLAQPEAVKPPSPVAPLQETRSSPAAAKSLPVSMAVEEVKIPSWLAPLARETDAIPTRTPALKTLRLPKRIPPLQLLRRTHSLSTRKHFQRRSSTRCLVTSCWVLRPRSPQQAVLAVRKRVCLLDLPQLAFS